MLRRTSVKADIGQIEQKLYAGMKIVPGSDANDDLGYEHDHAGGKTEQKEKAHEARAIVLYPVVFFKRRAEWE